MSTTTKAKPVSKPKHKSRYAWISANCSHEFKAMVEERAGRESLAPFVIRMIQAGLDATAYNGKPIPAKNGTVRKHR